MGYHYRDNFHTHAKIGIVRKLTMFGQKMVLAKELGRVSRVYVRLLGYFWEDKQEIRRAGKT